MKISDLKALYLVELTEARSFELLIAEAFGDLASLATEPKLKQQLEAENEESQRHGKQVGDLLEAYEIEPFEHRDQTMSTMLAEADRWLRSIEKGATRDAALIASAQRIQHYQIAVYGSLAAWAKLQGLQDVETLVTVLEEENAADASLSELAKGLVNEQAG